MSNQTPVFVAMCTCGGWVGVAVQDPKYIYDNAKFVASWIRAGYRIDKVTVDDIRSRNISPCKCERKTRQQRNLYV